MEIIYSHTNIIAQDWKLLVSFYKNVFNCQEVPPQRQQSGTWLSDGTGVLDAKLEGMHLRLPGFGEKGPTLEIYSFAHMEDNLPQIANRKGFGHIAFAVPDVEMTVKQILAHDGRLLGKIVKTTVQGVGELTFVYCQDPEGNIVEVQHWKR